MKRIALVNGPNLNLLGEREPDVYGHTTLAELENQVEQFAGQLGIEVRSFQSNSEGALIDFLHQVRTWADGIVINPGAFTHYSYALRDAIAGISPPVVEIHISDITGREAFRKISVLQEVCVKQISGLGLSGYFRAVDALVAHKALAQVQEVCDDKADADECLTSVVRILKSAYPRYSWVGIYLVEGNELVVHNYLGRPTPHERIPIGQGICGAAVTEEATIIIPDVNADPRYLACSIETKSEIVVPIYKGSAVVGELDLDSDLTDAFHDGDQELLEGCAEAVGCIL